ncbi:MAG: SH3 domain-containing protein [Symploca sp. SIO3C6]|uniref:SH3 domain-containing protein n=1 Tax=Symploca sp. SIO1C4 TaxID=2607765 RepID=A0A6B3N8I3_9CYAN|nr:SH3 domain-containing protein [Symploca sp. SIO3C6]NER29429.1 SH3 domain-containing protein [Symploca sp. SIO1C4]NET05273.1 SH3 domain-containing protein [Symploca sp. SIO2B6]NET52417.1 SH3 domain-containing protein [Merismopedia sp. SIO2A8]
MSLSRIAQFIIGFLLGVSILVGSTIAVAYYFFTKLAVTPPKPIFAEEEPQDSDNAKQASSEPVPKSQASKSSNQPIAIENNSSAPKLEPGAYQARVTWPEGLSLRQSPSLDAVRIGGVAYNQEIIILKESDDKRWQRVRLLNSQQEGWVKAGNVRRVN